MTRFAQSPVRQLPLAPFLPPTPAKPQGPITIRSRESFAAVSAARTGHGLRVLREDVYAEILRRRRRAQLAARHIVDAD